MERIVVPLLERDKSQTVALEGVGVASLLLGVPAQDDCAAYSIKGDVVLVAGSDYIRGVGFDLYRMGYLNEYDLGWYLAGANFSDVVSMGAKPLGLLSVIRYPKDLPDEVFASILEGVADSCRSIGAINVGGDIGSAESVVLSASAFGLVEPQSLLRRGGAQVGDYLIVTGQTGEAGAAMKLARAEKLATVDEAERSKLLGRWRRVRPRVDAGRLLATSGFATACVDTSDGLKAAITAIASSSNVMIVVEADWVPVSKGLNRAAALLECPVESLVFGDSVDFELVATVRPEGLETVLRKCNDKGLSFHVIGRVESGMGTRFRTREGDTEIPGREWRH
ncbi:thiamine-phosphate kinase [Buchananella felis]|uniref:thiamine-phosphate kinase n=1 Tax=Buchananella felis TaxID=3231492 RepID=UPI003528559F